MHDGIKELTALLFLKRGFLSELMQLGVDEICKEIGIELHEGERAIVEAAMDTPELVSVVQLWWDEYDELRDAGVLPKASPWEP